MSGGFIYEMVKSYRENRALLKRIKPFGRYKEVDYVSKVLDSNPQFKQASNEQLENIRNQAEKDRIQSRRRVGLIIVITLVIALILYILLFRMGNFILKYEL